MNLKNKKVLITGATGGIGNCIVKKLDELGAKIVASGTNEEKLKNLTKKFTNIQVEKFKSENKLLEAQRIEQRTKYDLEMLSELGVCSGIENYSRYLSGRKKGEAPPTLYEYLPKDALVFVDESHVSLPQIRGMYRGDRSRKETLTEYGFRLPSALDNRPLRFDEWEILSGQKIFVSATPGEYENDNLDQMVDLIVRPTGLLDPTLEIRPAVNQVDDLISEIYERTKKK